MTLIRFSERRAPRGLRTAALIAFIAGGPVTLNAQQLLNYTPNTRWAWTMGKWQPAMVLSHRFELVSGGDELLNLPTMTFGTAVSRRVAIGLDFTSNSEVTLEKLGGNETQWWMAMRGPANSRGMVSGLFGYNTAARSLDGAVTVRARAGLLSLITEARAFSDAFDSGTGGFAGAGGAAVHLTPYLSLAADVGRAFKPDSFGTVWSGGFTLAIPGTRHQFSFHATNGGATTLQGASRKKVLGQESVRYGFAFVAPLGTASQWSRIFRRGEAGAVAVVVDSGAVRVNLRDLAFTPAIVRIKVGQTVEWVNGDPLAHTVRADDRSWGSGFLNQGERFFRQFTVVGRYPYHCEPHPHMKGTVIVEM
jgi:plastocyanin